MPRLTRKDLRERESALVGKLDRLESRIERLGELRVRLTDRALQLNREERRLLNALGDVRGRLIEMDAYAEVDDDTA